MGRRSRWVIVLACFASATAAATPRGGGSFGGRGGFRSSSPSSSSGSGGTFRSSPPPSTNPGYGGGSGPIIVNNGPGYFGGYGYRGYYGVGDGGALIVFILVVAVAGAVVWAMRNARRRSLASPVGTGDEYESAEGAEGVAASARRAWVVRLQLALGRAAGVRLQQRLAELAETGNTSTVEGLVGLLQATTLELMRDRESIAQAALSSEGPLDDGAAERRFGGLALQERARFQVERVRAADGRKTHDTAAEPESLQAMEYLVITLVVASRVPIAGRKLDSADQAAATLTELGALDPDSLLALEVIWTPADPTDSLTTDDLLAHFPDLTPV
jgi:uncharacterized membrane protein